MDHRTHSSELRQIRWLLAFFIFGLVISGVTAFPLLHELNLLCHLLGVGDVPSASGHAGLTGWVLFVREGLQVTYARFPFIAYGTDWLAFAHLMIAVFFIGPWIDPVRNEWVIKAGLIACAGVLPLALICGPLRGIPFYWRLIDCSFGLLGCVPLLLILRLIKRMAARDVSRGTT